MRRTVTRDLDFRGQQLRKGDKLACGMSLGIEMSVLSLTPIAFGSIDRMRGIICLLVLAASLHG